MLGHRPRSIQGSSGSYMNPSFKQAKKRPSWNVEREKDRIERGTREWEMVVGGAVVGYCSKPNRRREVKKEEQRQRTKGGGKNAKKEKRERARVSVLLPADLSYWPSVARGEGFEAHGWKVEQREQKIQQEWRKWHSVTDGR